MKIALFCIAATLWLLLPCLADDWPQWRGSNRDCISKEEITTTWPADGPKVLWRASVGIGFSSVSVTQGRAYTLGNARDEETVWCLDATTGKIIWKHSYPSPLGPVYHEGGPVS